MKKREITDRVTAVGHDARERLMHARENAADNHDPGPSGEGRFASAPNDAGPDLVLRGANCAKPKHILSTGYLYCYV